jgi:hypothetical protein
MDGQQGTEWEMRLDPAMHPWKRECLVTWRGWSQRICDHHRGLLFKGKVFSNVPFFLARRVQAQSLPLIESHLRDGCDVHGYLGNRMYSVLALSPPSPLLFHRPISFGYASPLSYSLPPLVSFSRLPNSCSQLLSPSLKPGSYPVATLSRPISSGIQSIPPKSTAGTCLIRRRRHHDAPPANNCQWRVEKTCFTTRSSSRGRLAIRKSRV